MSWVRIPSGSNHFQLCLISLRYGFHVVRRERERERKKDRLTDRQTCTGERMGRGRARGETDIGRREGAQRQGKVWGHREGGGGRGGELTVQC